MIDEARKIARVLRNCDVVLGPRGFVKLGDLLTLRHAAEVIDRLSDDLERAEKEIERMNNSLMITTHSAAGWKKRADSAEKALRELDCSSCIHEGKEYPCSHCWSGEHEYKWKGPEVVDGRKE